MKVLIVDNNMDLSSWGAKDICNMVGRMHGVEMSVRRGPQEDLPSKPMTFDRLILSGSRASILETPAWAQGVDRLIQRFVEAGKPVLGICYGHQAIARALLGLESVGKSTVPEFGWTKLHKVAESRLLEGLPPEFYSFSSHVEEVVKLTDEFRCFIRSDSCTVQGFEMKEKPIFGIQFHPEKPFTLAQSQIQDWKKRKQKGLLEPLDGKRVFRQEIGERIFENFLGEFLGKTF